MNGHTFVFSALSALALTAGLTLTGTPAQAKQNDSAQQASKATEQLTVVAPQVSNSELYTPKSGVEGYSVLTLTRRINYADLNLTRPADAKRLDKRIDAAADQICGDLAHDAIPAKLMSLNCVNNAIRGAMQRANVAIAAAKLAAAER